MPNDSVLIVEDTPVNLKVVRVLLARQGYDIRTATSAEEALQVLEKFHPRLLLTDIQLPGMNGLELTRRVKSDPATRDTVVLAVTAFAMKSDEENALNAGCDGYVTKPIDTRTFPALIRHYLNPEHEAPSGGISSAEAVGTDPLIWQIRQEFLAAGLEESAHLISDFDSKEAVVRAHSWAGSAGSVGHPEITQKARELETELQNEW